MSINVIFNELKNKGLPFPKLMAVIDDGLMTIVFMLDETGKGNGIMSNHPSWDHKSVEVFYSTTNWDITRFSDYDGEVTISNKR